MSALSIGAEPLPLPIRRSVRPATDIGTRTAAAYRGATEAHERIKHLDAEMANAFAALDHATKRMHEEGAGVTVQMSAPLAAAWSTWKLGNEGTETVGAWEHDG